MKQAQLVIVCWVPEGSPVEVATLAYNNGAGALRVYPKNAYDARLSLGRDDVMLPFFDDARTAMAFMLEKRGFDGMCQIAIEAASEFFPSQDAEDTQGNHFELGGRTAHSNRRRA